MNFDISFQTPGPSISSKTQGILLVLIVMLGISFRLWTTMWIPTIYAPDSTQYLHLVEEILDLSYFQKDYNLDEGFLLSRRLQPLYPMLVAFFSILLPFDPDQVGILVSLFMSTLTFIPIFLFGSRLHSPEAGLLAALLFAFHPFALLWAGYSLTESTFSFLFITTLYLGLIAFEKNRVLPFVLSGVAAGLTFLTREAGLTIIAFLAGAAAIHHIFFYRISMRRSLLLIGAMLVAFSLICLPHFLNVKIRTGGFGFTSRVSTKSIVSSFFSVGGDRFDRDKLPGMELESKRIDDGKGSYTTIILKIAHKTVTNGMAYAMEFTKAVSPHVMICLFLSLIAGGVLALRERSRSILFRDLYLLGAMIQYVLLLGLVTSYMVDSRYMYPMVIPALIFVGIGILRYGSFCVSLLIQLNPFRSKAVLANHLFLYGFSLVWGCILFLQLWPRVLLLAAEAISPQFKWSGGHKQVAQHLLEKKHVGQGLKVISRKPFIAYYLKGTPVGLPKTFTQLQQQIKAQNGDLLVADSAVYLGTRPLLTDLVFGFYGPLSERIIYSRFLPEYQRIITIYDLRDNYVMPETKETSLDDRLRNAISYFKEGYLYEAARESSLILLKDPNNIRASEIIAKVYCKYFLTTNITSILPDTINYCDKYLTLKPDDTQVIQIYKLLKNN